MKHPTDEQRRKSTQRGAGDSREAIREALRPAHGARPGTSCMDDAELALFLNDLVKDRVFVQSTQAAVVIRTLARVAYDRDRLRLQVQEQDKEIMAGRRAVAFVREWLGLLS